MALGRKIRVLVVDDSALMRKLIPIILQKDEDIEVVATAVNGVFALRKAEKLRPDVITLDMDMPGMDGLTTLKHVVERFGIPVVVVSSLTTEGAEHTMKALELGAMDFVAKPHHEISVHIVDIAQSLIAKVKAVAGSSPEKLHVSPAVPEVSADIMKRAAERAAKATLELRPYGAGKSAKNVVAIGISTGGPNALSYFLPKIPADFQAGILIVQHMPAGFTEVFANRLNKICRIEVKEARDGDIVIHGRALVAPGGKHLKIKKTAIGAIAMLSESSPVNGHRPSADVLFHSVAREYGKRAVGVIMTGMGEDGAEGIGEMRRAGARTIAQDEASSVVFGMPRVAIERGYAEKVVSLDDMAEEIVGAMADMAKDNGGGEYAAAK